MTEPARGSRVPFDWWTIYHKLMFEKEWTREQIGRLTLNDLRVLTNPEAPPEPGEDRSFRARIDTFEEFEAMRTALREEDRSWI